MDIHSSMNVDVLTQLHSHYFQFPLKINSMAKLIPKGIGEI